MSANAHTAVMTDLEQRIQDGRQLSAPRPRINRIMEDRFYGRKPRVDIQRAVLFTQSMMQTEAYPQVLRTALAIQYMMEHIEVVIQPHELIVGTAGGPGRYCVLYPETRGGQFPRDLPKILKAEGKAGYAMTQAEVDTVLNEVVPYWKGKTSHELYLNMLPRETRRVIYGDGSSIVGLSQKELEKQAFFDLVQLFFHFTTLTKERMWNMGNLIAVTNFKGGVGKTTTTLNLGAALSAAGKRVLLVDNDPQGNLTAALGYTPPEQKHTLATLLLAAIDYPEDLDIHIGRAILHSETGVDLIGANRRLADAAARLQIMQMSQYNAVGDAECSCETVMATLLLPLRSAYDYIIIDCGLKHELLTVNALTAADYCIIPVQSHFLASEGIPDVLDMVRSVQAKFNPQLKIAGILLTMYQSRPQLCQSVRSGVSEVYGEQFHVFERPIEYSIKVAECPAAGQSILSYAPKNAAAESYRSLAREVLHLG